MLSRCFLDFSVSVRALVIGLSQISSFFSSNEFQVVDTASFPVFPRASLQVNIPKR